MSSQFLTLERERRWYLGDREKPGCSWVLLMWYILARFVVIWCVHFVIFLRLYYTIHSLIYLPFYIYCTSEKSLLQNKDLYYLSNLPMPSPFPKVRITSIFTKFNFGDKWFSCDNLLISGFLIDNNVKF